MKKKTNQHKLFFEEINTIGVSFQKWTTSNSSSFEKERAYQPTNQKIPTLNKQLPYQHRAGQKTLLQYLKKLLWVVFRYKRPLPLK